MKNKRFFCNGCNRYFDEAKIYCETHGLDNPPYERVAVCPRCDSDDFIKFEPCIEKLEVAERLLTAVKSFNLHIGSLEDVFGIEMKNCELTDGVEMLIEFICEMFDFLNVDKVKKIFDMTTDNDLQGILKFLKGEG